MLADHLGHTVQAVLGRVAVDALVHNPIAVPVMVEQLLQIRRVCLFGVDAGPGRKAVAEANQQRPARAGRGSTFRGTKKRAVVGTGNRLPLRRMKAKDP